MMERGQEGRGLGKVLALTSERYPQSRIFHWMSKEEVRWQGVKEETNKESVSSRQSHPARAGA